MCCSYKFKCPRCKTEFEWHDGSGKRFDILHCDKCGRELWTTERFLEYDNIKCQCGGYFDKEVPVICPYCGGEINNPRSHILNAAIWENDITESVSLNNII